MVVIIDTNSVNFKKLKKIRFNRGLNLLFTKKQIVIIDKINNFEPLNKTEKELYSRIVKPKFNAIIDLYEIAITLRDKI